MWTSANRFSPDVAVIDPWEAVIPGGDANDASLMRSGFETLQGIFRRANERSSLLIVHHAREGGEAAWKAVGFDAGSYSKGSKTLRSMARIAFNIAPANAEDGSKIDVACGKCNDGPWFSTRGAQLVRDTRCYELDPGFDVNVWLDAVDGKRSSSVGTPRDLLEIVRAGHTETGAILAEAFARTGAEGRTVKGWLHKCLRFDHTRLRASLLITAAAQGAVKGVLPRGTITPHEALLDTIVDTL